MHGMHHARNIIWINREGHKDMYSKHALGVIKGHGVRKEKKKNQKLNDVKHRSKNLKSI